MGWWRWAPHQSPGRLHMRRPARRWRYALHLLSFHLSGTEDNIEKQSPEVCLKRQRDKEEAFQARCWVLPGVVWRSTKRCQNAEPGTGGRRGMRLAR